MRDLSVRQHGYDGTWGRMLVHAFTARGLVDVNVRGEVWTMRGGTDSAEWYVAALERALAVVPADIFPPGFDPHAAIAAGARPGVRDPVSDFRHRVGAAALGIARRRGNMSGW